MLSLRLFFLGGWLIESFFYIFLVFSVFFLTWAKVCESKKKKGILRDLGRRNVDEEQEWEMNEHSHTKYSVCEWMMPRES